MSTRLALQRLLDALPVPKPSDSETLDRLRWALGDALPESQRAAMPPLAPLAAHGRDVLAERLADSACPPLAGPKGAIP